MNFLNGTVVSGGVKVPALGDAVLETDVQLPAESNVVTVGLRPQHLEVSAADSSVKVDLRERLGGVAYDYLTTPTGERIVVETKGDDPIDPGTTVEVKVEAGRALFFDAVSEKRIR